MRDWQVRVEEAEGGTRERTGCEGGRARIRSGLVLPLTLSWKHEGFVLLLKVVAARLRKWLVREGRR